MFIDYFVTFCLHCSVFHGLRAGLCYVKFLQCYVFLTNLKIKFKKI